MYFERFLRLYGFRWLKPIIVARSIEGSQWDEPEATDLDLDALDNFIIIYKHIFVSP